MGALTPTMRMALSAVEEQQGRPAKELPGGLRTIEALMKRGKVEIAGHDWRVYLPNPKHRHSFQRTMHIDGCHFFGESGVCKCGATFNATYERDFKGDPYSMVWAEPTSDEPCKRCEELIAGARSRWSVVIARR
jgi:hypothetical protein